MTERCGECERSAIRVHTIEIELEHKDRVIAELRRKVEALEAAAKSKKKT